MRLPAEVGEYLAKIGRKGGQAGAGKESPTSRKNGANGGRPRKDPKSPTYGAHRFNAADRWSPRIMLHKRPEEEPTVPDW